MFAGEAYDKLSDTYVIFICDFAPFASELYRYSVRNMIWETKEPLNDGSQTIILSTKGKNKSEVPIELVNFLEYVGQENDEPASDDDYVRRIQEQIKRIKQNRDWEGKYMLLEQMMRDERMEGMQEGLKKGMQQGQERINQLIILLSKQNRSEDIIKAASDKEYQEKLLKEFNL